MSVRAAFPSSVGFFLFLHKLGGDYIIFILLWIALTFMSRLETRIYTYTWREKYTKSPLKEYNNRKANIHLTPSLRPAVEAMIPFTEEDDSGNQRVGAVIITWRVGPHGSGVTTRRRRPPRDEIRSRESSGGRAHQRGRTCDDEDRQEEIDPEQRSYG
jgi:hypothetical protein